MATVAAAPAITTALPAPTATVAAATATVAQPQPKPRADLDPSRIQVSSQRNPMFYVKVVKRILSDPQTKTVPTITVTALGKACSTAIATSTLLRDQQVVSITKIETLYNEIVNENNSYRKYVPRVAIVLTPNPDWKMEEPVVPAVTPTDAAAAPAIAAAAVAGAAATPAPAVPTTVADSAKTEAKTETKTEVKTEVKTEAKTATKP